VNTVALEVSEPQMRVLASNVPSVVFRGGVGSGKTHVGVLWVLIKAMNTPGSNGMIVTASYPMMAQSTLPRLIKVAREMGIVGKQGDRTWWEWHKGERRIDLPWCDSGFWLRSAEDPASLEGADLTWLYGDEVALWPEESYLNSAGRLREPGVNHQALYTFTPKGINWAHKQFGSEAPGMQIVESTSSANLWTPPSFIQRMERTYGKGSLFYQQQVLGRFVAFEGMVYKQWDPQANVVPPATGTKWVAAVVGTDWGWSEPGAMVVLLILPDSRILVAEEIKESYRDIDWWVETGRDLARRYGIHGPVKFYCDPAQPSNIQRFRDRGLLAYKGRNDRLAGMALQGGMISSAQLVVSASCEEWQGEITQYVFKRGPRKGAALEGALRWDEPDEKNDHLMDCTRYGLMGIVFPEEDAEEDIVEVETAFPGLVPDALGAAGLR
jgi:phage terminase large subunit